MNGLELLESSTKQVLKTAIEIEGAAEATLTKAYIRFNNRASQLLGAVPGESKVYVGFLSVKEPALVISSGPEAKGNLFTEARTVACGGKQNELLQSLGEKFEVSQGSNGLFLLTPIKEGEVNTPAESTEQTSIA